MVTAVYPGTFDPITNGHVDIAVRASKAFDKVIIAIYEDSPKRVVFNVEERVGFCREAVSHVPNIQVTSFTGLLVEYVRSVGAQVMFRGLRAGSDFDYEFDMALMNKNLAPDLDAVFFMSSLEWQFLSSSRMKEVVGLGGDVSHLVPPDVDRALRAKLQVSAQ
jgi:pantetheine-phosphate adenylyltransferase